jgi:hypothetical protein
MRKTKEITFVFLTVAPISFCQNNGKKKKREKNVEIKNG